MGLHMEDLDGLEYSFIMDMMTEQDNDDFKYDTLATQADFDRW